MDELIQSASRKGFKKLSKAEKDAIISKINHPVDNENLVENIGHEQRTESTGQDFSLKCGFLINYFLVIQFSRSKNFYLHKIIHILF